MPNNESSLCNKIKIGRFAPSPTGALHFGSLIAAVASYLCARQHLDSQWLLRIEDVDTQREQKGAAKSIIETLETYGFHWDGEITYQSQRTEYYQQYLELLGDNIYPCSCTRKDLVALSTELKNGIKNPSVKNPSIRLKTTNDKICFQDQCQPNSFCEQLEDDIGDFIVKRRDGLFAYQLAVVVDDHLQGINHVVRGADLFDNTPRQIYLQQLLGFSTPEYLHFPVATSSNGKKLSKQNLSPEVSKYKKRDTLVMALRFLGQKIPEANEFTNIEDLWTFAQQSWDSSNIPRKMNIEITP
ncbi:UNVERIFIED_CONTAM: hypothetical protein GTU68_053594 [Idotea baltica]|nr:hypothetical protein [Idotea baltica]